MALSLSKDEVIAIIKEVFPDCNVSNASNYFQNYSWEWRLNVSTVSGDFRLFMIQPRNHHGSTFRVHTAPSDRMPHRFSTNVPAEQLKGFLEKIPNQQKAAIRVALAQWNT